MADLIANPGTFIAAALAEGVKRNITGYTLFQRYFNAISTHHFNAILTEIPDELEGI